MRLGTKFDTATREEFDAATRALLIEVGYMDPKTHDIVPEFYSAMAFIELLNRRAWGPRNE